MKFIVIGGGPSGLYFALLSKKRFPHVRVIVYEQNPNGATYGFGIVLADRGLERLRAADAVSYEAIMAASFVTRHREISHCGDALFVEGGGFGGAIERLRLLNILDDLCRKEGVEIHYGVRIGVDSDLSDADLVIGADGVNSALRGLHEEAFGTTRWMLSNRLAWYGTQRHFPHPILSFKRHSRGHFVAAAYPYTERMSTFVAECDARTWEESGFATMDDDERRRVTEEIFAEELAGQTLQSNRSIWHSLPVIRNANWSVGNKVLVGDALHSAHPTIGSGTRIAMEDSIALVDALCAHPDEISKALVAFRAAREPHKQKLVDAAEKSFTWYESFAQKMDALGPVEFTFDFLTRTGRITEERMRSEYPEFMNKYGYHWKAAS